jgi:oxygen-independent coproporphyrinogen-3 oxidase
LENYINFVYKQIDVYKKLFKWHKFNKLFFSWGSFASIWLKNIELIFDKIKKEFDIDKNSYVFFEWDVHFLSDKKEIYNEIQKKFWNNVAVSLWVQTINKEVLKKNNRNQTNAQIEKVVNMCKEFNYEIKLDLIAWLEWEKLDSFKKSLEYVYNLKPDHIHVYKLDNNKASIKNKILRFLMFEYAYDFLVKNSGIKTRIVNNWSWYNVINYSSKDNYKKIDYLEWHEMSSILTLWHNCYSYIWWKIKYYTKCENNDFDNYKYKWIIKNKKSFITSLFTSRMWSYLDIDYINKKIKWNIELIMKNELNMLNKKWKITKKDWIIFFHLKRDLFIYIYLVLTWKINNLK